MSDLLWVCTHVTACGPSAVNSRGSQRALRAGEGRAQRGFFLHQPLEDFAGSQWLCLAWNWSPKREFVQQAGLESGVRAWDNTARQED